MHGAFLSTGRTEDYVPLGDAGQPVHKAALQIIAALTRKSPELANFLAIPKSNEQGSVIDWYSPVPGEAMEWSSASESERTDARQKLQTFKAGIASTSNALITSSTKGNQSDTVIFGKLLGFASHSPDDTCIKIIKTQTASSGGVTESYNQPVLTFWGFILNEEDRKRAPLYFLEPSPVANTAPAASNHLASTAPLATNGAPPTVASPAISSRPVNAQLPESAAVPEKKKPWWLFWSGWRLGFGWLWPLLLLLLLLLLLSLLRGCIPGISLPHFGAPSSTSTDLGSTAPLLNNHSGEPSGFIDNEGAQKTDTTTAIVPDSNQSQAELPLPSNESSPVTPPDLQEPSSPSSSNETAERQAHQSTDIPPLPSSTTDQTGQPQPLNIPPGTTEGPAGFLDGRYRAGAGIQDRRTGKPLRLEYAFEKNGKGKVTVQRPDGIICTGGVTASINAGNLAINSQGQAGCSDGSQYDMPEVNCKPGTESIADCTGKYGNETFPMSMRKADK